MAIEKGLVMCCECGKIRISDEHNFWVNREENPKLYDKFCGIFKDKITHGYCPEDFKKVKKEIDEYRNNSR